MKIKKKYEQINCSNNHIFSIDYDGEIRKWNCVVLDREVVTYERSKETNRIRIEKREEAPGVLQIDTVISIYGEQIPFQLENGVPFIKLGGEWVPSDTFTEAKRKAAVKMYKKYSLQEAIAGAAALLVVLAITIINGDMGDWWMLMVLGLFFLTSAAMRMARLHVELQALKEAEAEAEKEAAAAQEDAIAAARALHSGKEKE